MLKKALELLTLHIAGLLTQKGKTASDVVVVATAATTALIALQAVTDKITREETLSEENRGLLEGCKTLTNAAFDTIDPKLKEVNVWK